VLLRAQCLDRRGGLHAGLLVAWLGLAVVLGVRVAQARYMVASLLFIWGGWSTRSPGCC
jgi:hypothetical protein